MNTLRNYIEAMFANMPGTEKVLKAKRELWQMMEDKYNELIADGVSENEAIAKVISEFGNLEDLAEDLELKEEYKETVEKSAENPRRQVSFEEVKEYLADKAAHAGMLSFGILLCIVSLCGVLITDGLGISDTLGVAAMFLCIAAGVVSIVMSGSKLTRWKFFKNEACTIDYESYQAIAEAQSKYAPTHTMRLIIGILFCSLCWLPCMIIDELAGTITLFENLAAVILFVFAAIGVFLIVFTNNIKKGYEVLLGLNDKQSVSGTYKAENNVKYDEPWMATVLELYWPTVTCIYFITSFTSYNWGTSWLIWPIASILRRVLVKKFTDGEAR